MPLTEKGNEIKSAMQKQYGAKKGASVFFASANKGTIKGVEPPAAHRGSASQSEHMPHHMRYPKGK